MKMLMTIAVLMLAACTTTGQVIPTGKDTYLVSASGGSGPFSKDELEAAVTRANEYCQSKGLVATISETQNNGVPGWTRVKSTVQFRCSDEAHQGQTVLRPDKGVSTVN